MNSEDNFVDDTHNACSELWKISILIGQLGDSFYHTGNNVLSEDLRHYAKIIDEQQSKIRRAVGKEVGRQCNAPMEQISAVVKTLIGRAS